MTHFFALIKVVNLVFEWKNTNMKDDIHVVEARISIAIARLGSENSLWMCGKVYDNTKNVASIIVKEFCAIIKNHWKPLVILKLI
jgi:hypothetical protein